MRVAVTGSSGFIGHRLVNDCLAQAHSVLAIDKQRGKAQHRGLTERVLDILDYQALTEAIDEFSPDVLVHLAARTDLEEKNVLSGYADNIQGVENVVDAVGESISIKRAVFTSSQLVCKIGYVPSSDEDYCPDTLYGESKVLTEKIVQRTDGGGKEWCLVRPTTIWGPGMNAHYQEFFKMISRGMYFHCGRRPLWKSYGFVGNIAYQYTKLLEAPAEHIHSRTFYLADYQPISLRKWANAFQRKLGAKRIPTCPIPLARVLAATGDILNFAGYESFPFNSFRLNNILTEYRFDMSATEEICGQLPFTFEQGIHETARWLYSERIITGWLKP